MIKIFLGFGVGLLLGWILSSPEDMSRLAVGGILGFLAGVVAHLKLSRPDPSEEGDEEAQEPSALVLPPSLLASYKRSLVTRHEALSALRPAFEAGDPAALNAIRNLAHKLRGSGATYGAPQISQAAAKVEEAPPDELGELLEELLVVLERSAESLVLEATKEPPAEPECMSCEEFATAYDRALELAASRGNRLCLGLVKFLDLEGIRAEHGEPAIKRILERAVRCLSGVVEKTDLVAPWRSSVVVVLLKDASRTEARGLLSRFEGSFAKDVFQVHGGVRVHPRVGWSAEAVDPERGLEETLVSLSCQAGEETAAAPPPDAPGAPAKILMVDDDETLAEFVRDCLSEQGFEVVHISDGESALQRVTEIEPDLCLVDVHMPGVGGFEVLERLRSEPISLEIPIVMLTAAGREEDTVRGFDLGANDYVVKPFVPGVLIARIRRLLG